MFAVRKLMSAATLALAALHAQAAPVLTFSAPAATSDASVDVAVQVSGMTDLSTYNVSVNFNPGILKFASLTEGAFLATAGAGTDFGFADNDTAGLINYVFGSTFAPTGANGSGTLFTIHFDTLAAGMSALSFSDVLFLNSSPNGDGDIAITAVNSALAVTAANAVPEPTSVLLLAIGGAAFLARRRGAAMKLAA